MMTIRLESAPAKLPDYFCGVGEAVFEQQHIEGC